MLEADRERHEARDVEDAADERRPDGNPTADRAPVEGRRQQRRGDPRPRRKHRAEDDPDRGRVRDTRDEQDGEPAGAPDRPRETDREDRKAEHRDDSEPDDDEPDPFLLDAVGVEAGLACVLDVLRALLHLRKVSGQLPRAAEHVDLDDEGVHPRLFVEDVRQR